jgi:hypothetical protein
MLIFFYTQYIIFSFFRTIWEYMFIESLNNLEFPKKMGNLDVYSTIVKIKKVIKVQYIYR